MPCKPLAVLRPSPSDLGCILPSRPGEKACARLCHCFAQQLLDQPAPPRAPVRLYVMGAEEWREYDSWPPPGFGPVAFYLSAGGGLSTQQPDSQRARLLHVYDPADPTPAVHGPRLSGVRPTGDMAELENRSDVLLFTAEPLAASLEVIGPVSAELFFRSSLEHTDFFLVLCDVAPNGRSTNVCDGYVRVRPTPSQPFEPTGPATYTSNSGPPLTATARATAYA